MELKNGFEDLLRNSMQANAEEPPQSLVEKARRQVMLRKKNKNEREAFVLPRWLFNFRISFYHALLLVLLLETGAIYQTHRGGAGYGKDASSMAHSDVSAALSSTLLPGTTTYLRQ